MTTEKVGKRVTFAKNIQVFYFTTMETKPLSSIEEKSEVFEEDAETDYVAPIIADLPVLYRRNRNPLLRSQLHRADYTLHRMVCLKKNS